MIKDGDKNGPWSSVETGHQLKSQLCKQPLYCSIELVYFKKFHPWLVWFCSLVVKITKNLTEVWKISKTLCLKKCEEGQKKSWKHIVKFTGKQGKVCFVLTIFFYIWIILWHVRKKNTRKNKYCVLDYVLSKALLL